MSAALPVLLSAGRRHPSRNGTRPAAGAAAGQPVPGGNLRWHLRRPAGTHLSAREGERDEDPFASVASDPGGHFLFASLVLKPGCFSFFRVN